MTYSSRHPNNTTLKNPNRLILAQLNINSLRNKFDSLVRMLHNNLDILLISETKIDSSFPTAQIECTTYRLDRTVEVYLSISGKTYHPHR